MQSADLRRWVRHAARASILAALLWSPAGGAADALPKDELVIGIRQAPDTLNPLIGHSNARVFLSGLTLRAISGPDKTGNTVCYLCETLPTLENGGARMISLPDGRPGMDVTFTLRPNLVWADGVPLTAQDVEFSWRLSRDRTIGASYGQTLSHIVAITVENDRTFTLHYDRVDYSYNWLVNFWLVPEHIEGPILARLKDRSDYARESAYVTDPTNPGLWLGPYRLAGYEPGRAARFVRAETWAGPAAHFPGITVRMIENTAILEADFLTGSVDYIAGELGLTVDQGLELKARRAYSYDFAIQSGLSYEHVDFNLTNPLLADRRVRQAMLMAIDRAAITRHLFDGLQPVADSFVSPIDRGYDPQVRKYPYDPTAAARLLDEAGFLAGPDGIRVGRDGRRLALTLSTTADNRIRELVELELQAKWQAVGIAISIANAPGANLLGHLVPQGKFDLALYTWNTALEYPPTFTLLSTSIPDAANDYAGGNFPRFADPQMDRLIMGLTRELDAGRRLPIWARIQDRYATELPALPLFFESSVFVIPTWLKGIDPASGVAASTQWVEDWRAE